ncbi:hypothetical protein E2C01_056031 [Portunus trituberculatus]|uniref:Uncharacterized protein n=1 Tax=Portunus trituberculatus TaxID=210409 RepID=A0A5B7GT00_PORTR|nr:hypothetical protein [Portunus trituberculatus]
MNLHKLLGGCVHPAAVPETSPLKSLRKGRGVTSFRHTLSRPSSVFTRLPVKDMLIHLRRSNLPRWQHLSRDTGLNPLGVGGCCLDVCTRSNNFFERPCIPPPNLSITVPQHAPPPHATTTKAAATFDTLAAATTEAYTRSSPWTALPLLISTGQYKPHLTSGDRESRWENLASELANTMQKGGVHRRGRRVQTVLAAWRLARALLITVHGNETPMIF